MLKMAVPGFWDKTYVQAIFLGTSFFFGFRVFLSNDFQLVIAPSETNLHSRFSSKELIELDPTMEQTGNVVKTGCF